MCFLSQSMRFRVLWLYRVGVKKWVSYCFIRDSSCAVLLRVLFLWYCHPVPNNSPISSTAAYLQPSAATAMAVPLPPPPPTLPSLTSLEAGDASGFPPPPPPPPPPFSCDPSGSDLPQGSVFWVLVQVI